MSDRFAGIVSASGGTIEYSLPYTPINYIQTVGGLEDESIAPPPAMTSSETALFWANVDECNSAVVDENDYYEQTTYSGGTWSTEVRLYVVTGQGHAWPNQQPEGLNSQTLWQILEGQRLTPQAVIDSTIGKISSSDLPKGIKKSLIAPLNTTLKRLDDSNKKNDRAAKKTMRAFIRKVKALRKKKVPAALADELIINARRTTTMLN